MKLYRIVAKLNNFNCDLNNPYSFAFGTYNNIKLHDKLNNILDSICEYEKLSQDDPNDYYSLSFASNLSLFKKLFGIRSFISRYLTHDKETMNRLLLKFTELTKEKNHATV